MKLICGIAQALLGIVKSVLYVLLPVISITVPIVAIPVLNVSGLTLIRMNNTVAYLTLAAYALLLIFSVGPLQRFGVVPAVIALAMEIITIATAGSFMSSGDINFLHSLIPPEFQQYLQAGLSQLAPEFQQYSQDLQAGLSQLAKPGIGLLLNMLLTVLYAVSSIASMSISSDSSSRSNGGHGGSRTNTPRISDKGQSSGGNRSHPML